MPPIAGVGKWWNGRHFGDAGAARGGARGGETSTAVA
jgi:hypothetical protein